MCKIKSNSEMWHSLFQTPVYIIDQTFQKSASTHGTMQSSRSHPLNLEGAEHNDASFFLIFWYIVQKDWGVSYDTFSYDARMMSYY